MYLLPQDIGILSPILASVFGLAVGLAHAFEADHIAALGTQVSNETSTWSGRRRITKGITKYSIMGAAWGAGHATTLVLFGMVVYMAASLIQDWIFSGLEMGVGIMLLALGASAIIGRGILWPAHKHHHIHKDGTAHSHNHSHDASPHNHTHRSYIIGLVHGLAGSGGLVALAAATMDSMAGMLMYMLAFGAGAALGMCATTGLLGTILATINKNKKVYEASRYVAGAFSILIGIVILYDISTTAIPGLLEI